MNTDGPLDVADRLFGAIERGECETVASMWADDVAVWHSGDSCDSDRVRALKVIRWFINVTTARGYEILDRQVFDGGFVQQHVLRARRFDDVSIEMRVCVVIKMDAEGLITRIDEYFDPTDMDPLMRSTT